MLFYSPVSCTEAMSSMQGTCTNKLRSGSYHDYTLAIVTQKDWAMRRTEDMRRIGKDGETCVNILTLDCTSGTIF